MATWAVIQSRIARAIIAASGVDADHVLWSQNKAPRPAADGIVMRLMGITQVGDTWVDVEDNPLDFATKVVTSVDATANTVSVAAHDLHNGDGPVRLTTTGTLPGGLAVDTDYWVVAPTTGTLKFCSTFIATGGADIDGSPSGNPVTTIDLTDAGTGTMSIEATEDTLRAGQEINYVARSTVRAVLSLECHTNDSTGEDMAVAILHRVASRLALPTQVATLAEAGVGVLEVDTVRAVRGRLDAILFEPRAMLDIQLSILTEESEFGTIMQSAEITPTIDEVEYPTETFQIGSEPR